MRIDYLHQNIAKLLVDRTVLLGVVGFLTLSNTLLVIVSFCASEKTILIPTETRDQFWVHGNQVSGSYLEERGRDVVRLLLDKSPASFPYNHAALLKYAAPESYGTLQKQLLREGEQYTALQLSTNFKPTEITPNPQTLTVEVKGILTTYLAGQEVRQSNETLTLKFIHRGAGLLLE